MCAPLTHDNSSARVFDLKTGYTLRVVMADKMTVIKYICKQRVGLTQECNRRGLHTSLHSVLKTSEITVIVCQDLVQSFQKSSRLHDKSSSRNCHS